MKTINDDLLKEMGSALSEEDRDELAIPSYTHPNTAMRWMAWRRVRALIDFLDRWADTCDTSKNGRRVMDFGCGTGVLFSKLREIAGHIYAVDLVTTAADLLIEHREWTDITTLHPDDAAGVIEDKSLDVVVAAEVLEHVDDVTERLDFFKSKLKENGRLFVSLPTENALYRLGRRLAGFSGHYHHSNAYTIHAQIVEFGFRPIEVKSIPLPGPLAIYRIAAYAP